MNELALFAGAGGGILGGSLLGWKTVCAVEIDAYCTGVLIQRQNDGILPPFPVWDDVSTFDGKPWRGIVDVVSGGFPCQDISAAGKGAGIEGSKSGLWVEMARIIGEVRPRFVFVENSPMLVARGLGTVLGDLAQMGFDARWGIVSAADVGAPHLRERIWIVANARGEGRWKDAGSAHADESEYAGGAEIQTNILNGDGEGNTAGDVAHPQRPERRAQSSQRCGSPSGRDTNGLPQREESSGGVGASSAMVAESPGDGRQQRRAEPTGQQRGFDAAERGSQAGDSRNNGWWLTEPDVGRVANGVAHRVDRVKALGNGQVPQCAAEAWRLLTETATE